MIDGTDLGKETWVMQESRPSGVKFENQKGGIQFPKSWHTFKK